MKLHVEIDMDGAEFSEGDGLDAYEIGAMLEGVASIIGHLVRNCPSPMPLSDPYGNTCGRAWTTET
jgi:hypothetical protein